MRALALLLCLASLSACTPGGIVIDDEPDAELPDAYPYHTAEQIGDAIRSSTAPVAFYAADGRMNIESPQLDQRATYTIRSRFADSTVLNVRGPLGIEVGRALVTPDEFVGYDKFNKRLFVGDPTVADRFVPGAGDSRVLSLAMAGLLAPEADAAWTVTPDSGRYLMVHRRTDGTRRILIVDPGLWRVTLAQEVDASNAVVAEQRFSAFDTIDGVVMPRRIVLVAPPRATRLTLEHNNLDANPEDFRLRFRRPADDDVEVIPIE
ncbi:MAG: DUF4292 domain-containing protein [Bacteroidota bacterium]